MPASTPKPRRRWYQFSLRTLLVATLAACLFAGWVAYRLRQAEANRQRVENVEQAIAALEESGGRVGTGEVGYWDVGGFSVFYHWKFITKRPPTWLERLFDDPGCADDPTAVVVAPVVLLHETGIGDADLENLTALSDVRTLCLRDTRITDAGLERLKGRTDLQTLNLDRTQVTDAGLGHLEGMSNLQVLTLDGTQVTDAGLEHVKKLTRLQHLHLRDTQVTDHGVADLHRALPDCTIRSAREGG